MVFGVAGVEPFQREFVEYWGEARAEQEIPEDQRPRNGRAFATDLSKQGRAGWEESRASAQSKL